MTKYWSSEDIQKVKELWDLGHSSTMIAAMFPGKTRNSIIGLVHRNRDRLAIPKRQTVVSKRPPARPKSEPRRVVSASVVQKKVDNKFKLFEAKLRKEAEPPPEAYHAGNKTIFNLRAFDCRAIIGTPDGEKSVYCGNIVMAGTSWCKHHFDLYTVKQEKKNGFVPKASKRNTFGAFRYGDNNRLLRADE
jgi:hypothetical protein